MREPTRFHIGPWIVLPSQNLLEREARPIRLEPRAMDVLVTLAQADGAVVSIESLLTTVWKDVSVGDGSVYLAIRQLRQAFGEDSRYIETIPKRGYRLTVAVERPPTEGAAPAPPVVPEAPPAVAAAVVSGKRAGRWVSVGILVLVAAVAAVAAVAFDRTVRPAAAASVAVLPFDNLSADPEQQFFADGVTIETLNTLARVRDLRVTSPTSSFHFKDHDTDVRAAGVALGVEHVLQGSVRTAGDQVRITVQLSRVRTGERVWSETYERRRADIFRIQDDIATSVADALQVRLGIGDVGRAPGMTRNVAAYEEYLRGQARNLDWQPASFPLAVAHLQRAVALDPSFSMAWASLSSVYLNGMFIVPDRAAEWRQRAAEALARATALTPEAPDVLLETGVTEARRQDWVAASRAFERLHAVYARDGLADRASGPQGILLLAVGHTRDAVAALERARSEDPLAPAYAGFLTSAYLADGNVLAALAETDRGLTLDGLDGWLLNLGLIAALNGRDPATIEARLAAIPAGLSTARISRSMLRFTQAPAGAAAEIRRLAASADVDDTMLLAEWAAYYAEPELALQLLTDAVPRVSHPGLLWQPLFRDVRRLPAFMGLARRLGFVEYWRIHGPSALCRPTPREPVTCQ